MDEIKELLSTTKEALVALSSSIDRELNVYFIDNSTEIVLFDLLSKINSVLEIISEAEKDVKDAF